MRLRAARQALDAQDLGEPGAIHDAVALRRHLDLVVAPGRPLRRCGATPARTMFRSMYPT